MGRPMLGSDVVEMGQEMIRQATTIDELRQAQSVVLPLAYGLGLQQTAKIIGQSVTWTSRLRNRFLAGETVGDGQRLRPGGRRRKNLSLAREREILTPFLARAAAGGILVVPPFKAELEKALGRTMALSSVYNLLHRHGWRKIAPDKQHPQSDPVVQAEWKKTRRDALNVKPRRWFKATQAYVSGRGALWTHQRRTPLLGAVSNQTVVSMNGHADP